MGIQVNAPAQAAGGVERITAPEESAVQTLKRNEQLVYDVLCRSEAALKAYDLLEKLQDQGLRAPMTIYRALEALIAYGYVKKIVSLNAYIAIRPGRPAQARAFLICKACMQAKEILLDKRQVAALFSPLPVSASDVCIEAFGECDEVCGDRGKTGFRKRSP